MRACLLVALIGIFVAPVVFAEQARPEVWIISGQSNACGRAELPGADPDPKVQMYEKRAWVEAKEPLPLGGTVGPWLACATEVAKEGIPIRLCGFASGGQPIKYWDEEAAGWKALSANIKMCGEGASVFLWYQGESDGVDKTDAKTYEAKLKDLVSRVRTLAKNPKMLLVVVQVARGGEFTIIREAQREFVAADGNAILVPALGRAGDLHLTRDGYFELGREIARALLKTRYQKANDWPGPVLDRAVFGPDAKTVLLHFAEVKKLAGLTAEDLSAVDATGPAKCVKVEAQNTRAALTFDRELKPPAKIQYAGGANPKASLVDEAGNRAPAVLLEITPGSPPDDKETKAPNGSGPAVKPGDVKK